MKEFKNICYGDGSIPRQYLDVYTPEDEQPSHVLVYLHGGGLEAGSKDTPRLIYTFADSGIAVVAPNYRMYPTARYPEFIMDAAASVAWVKNNIKCDSIYIGGSSAGAYLAMMLCMDKRYLAPYGIDPDALSGFVFDAGQPTVHFNVMREAGFDPRKVAIDERAPIYHICEGRKYPPMLVFCCCESDIANRYEQTLLFISTLKDFGHTNVEFHLMESRYGHCGYCNDPIFKETIEKFILEKKG